MKVAFYLPDKPNWYEKLIRLRCNSPIVHTEFVFNEYEYKTEGQYLSFSSVLGVGARFQQNLNFLTEEWILLNLPSGDWHKGYDFCQGMKGKDYDLPAILGFMTPWSQRNDHDVYCTESTVDIIQYVWEPGFIVPKILQPWRVAPSDLYNMMEKTHGE